MPGATGWEVAACVHIFALERAPSVNHLWNPIKVRVGGGWAVMRASPFIEILNDGLPDFQKNAYALR